MLQIMSSLNIQANWNSLVSGRPYILTFQSITPFISTVNILTTPSSRFIFLIIIAGRSLSGLVAVMTT